MTRRNLIRTGMATAGALPLVPAVAAQAQQRLPWDPFPLWTDQAPGATGRDEKDTPTLTPYIANPDRATGASVVICPGGGYAVLAAHEGRDYALWLNELGVSAFVLKYRLASAGYRHPVMLHDAARSIRTIRARAGEWKLDTARVGIMGSSAGGHLASTLLTHWDRGDQSAPDAVDRQSSRPDVGILCYPVITMAEWTHAGSKRNLLGESPSPELVKLLSNEEHVTKETPPAFLFHTVEDTGVTVRHSLEFAAALARNGVPFALHVYPKGAHGIGLGTRQWDPANRHPWTGQCAFWLKERGFAR